MSETEAYDLCIGRAFNRRKHARRELADLEAQAKTLGTWLGVIGKRLAEERSYIVSKEHDILVFRTTGMQHMLADEGSNDTPKIPTTDDIVSLFNHMTELREKIAELDGILQD